MTHDMRSDASRTRSFAREREASAAGCSPRVAAAAVNPSCAMTNSTTPGPAPLALTACVTCPRRINATLVVIPQPGHGSPSSAFMRHPDTCTSIAELTCATANTPAKISGGAMLTRSIRLRANRAALDHLSFTVSHGNGTPPQTRVAALCGEVDLATGHLRPAKAWACDRRGDGIRTYLRDVRAPLRIGATAASGSTCRVRTRTSTAPASVVRVKLRPRRTVSTSNRNGKPGGGTA